MVVDALDDDDDDDSSSTRSERSINDYDSFFDTDSDDDDDARNYDSLGRTTLRRIQQNKPNVSSLYAFGECWIEGAGEAIGDSQVLRRIKIQTDLFEESTSWILELCLGLARNRSIERISLDLHDQYRHVIDDINTFLECNDQLKSIAIKGLMCSRFVSMILMASQSKPCLSELHFRKCEFGKNECAELATLLNYPTSKIQVLNLDGSMFLNWNCFAILSSALIGYRTLRILNMNSIYFLDDSIWSSLSSILSHPACSLEKLDISCTGIGDVGMALLGDALAINKTLQQLHISGNDSITSAGWEGFSICLRSPMSALQYLTAKKCDIDEDGFVAIFAALARNSSFVALNAHGNTDEFVSKRKATALCHILCDKTSIKHTYSSNHTFATIWGDRYFDRETFDEYASLLDLNKNEDKMEIAREKILTTHFPIGSGDLHVFASMS